MNNQQHHGGWVIVLSFCFGFILTIMPLPFWASAWRPDWVIMIMIYWCIAVPQRVGASTGWIIGLIHDTLTNTLFGQHALKFCLVAYLSVKFHRQIRLFPWWQQSLAVGILLFINHAIDTWIHGILGRPTLGLPMIYPIITSVILWRWIFVVLRDMRRTYQVF